MGRTLLQVGEIQSDSAWKVRGGDVAVNKTLVPFWGPSYGDSLDPRNDQLFLNPSVLLGEFLGILTVVTSLFSASHTWRGTARVRETMCAYPEPDGAPAWRLFIYYFR
jgi:hypothetical protein